MTHEHKPLSESDWYAYCECGAVATKPYPLMWHVCKLCRLPGY